MGKKIVSSGSAYDVSDVLNAESNLNKVTSLSSASTDTEYPSAKATYDAIQAGSGGSTDLNAVHYTTDSKTSAEQEIARTNIGAENVANKTTVLSAQSTDIEYPSAKAVHDKFNTFVPPVLQNAIDTHGIGWMRNLDELELEWDGDTQDKHEFDCYYQVYSGDVNHADFINGEVCFSSAENSETITSEMISEDPDTEGLYWLSSDYDYLIIVEHDLMVGSDQLYQGIYFYKDGDDDYTCYLWRDAISEKKLIDYKYLERGSVGSSNNAKSGWVQWTGYSNDANIFESIPTKFVYYGQQETPSHKYTFKKLSELIPDISAVTARYYTGTLTYNNIDVSINLGSTGQYQEAYAIDETEVGYLIRSYEGVPLVFVVKSVENGNYVAASDGSHADISSQDCGIWLCWDTEKGYTVSRLSWGNYTDEIKKIDRMFISPHDHSQYEIASNKSTTLTSSSTDTQYPTSKAVYDAIQAIPTSDVNAVHYTADSKTSAEKAQARNNLDVAAANSIGNCITALSTANKTATVTNFALIDGVRVSIRFTKGLTSNASTVRSLNINSTGSINIKYKGATTGAELYNIAADSIVTFIYYLGAYNIIGWDRLTYSDIGAEAVSNKVTTITSSSTDTEYPSAKAVFDTEQDIKEIAEGKTKTYVVSKVTNPSFDTQAATTTITTFTTIDSVVHQASELKLGDNIYIQEIDVPDRWCSITGSTATLCKLETAKVPVTDVQKNGVSVVTNTVANITVPTKTSDIVNDSGFLTQHQDISGKEDKTNKVTSMSASSTDTEYPSAKAVYDTVQGYLPLSAGNTKPLTGALYSTVQAGTTATEVFNWAPRSDGYYNHKLVLDATSSDIYRTNFRLLVKQGGGSGTAVYTFPIISASMYDRYTQTIYFGDKDYNKKANIEAHGEVNIVSKSGSSSTRDYIRLNSKETVVGHDGDNAFLYPNQYSSGKYLGCDSSINSNIGNQYWTNIFTSAIKMTLNGSNQDLATYLSGKANISDLATVAISGSYADLSNTPTIPVVPTNVSAFTNDAGYLTAHQSLSAYRTSADQDIIDAGKQNTLMTQTAYSAKGSATKVPQITTNSLGQVTGITEIAIAQPTVNNGTLTIQQNGTTVGTFTANQSGDTTINITGGGPSPITGPKYVHNVRITYTNSTTNAIERANFMFICSQSTGFTTMSGLITAMAQKTVAADGWLSSAGFVKYAYSDGNILGITDSTGKQHTINDNATVTDSFYSIGVSGGGSATKYVHNIRINNINSDNCQQEAKFLLINDDSTTYSSAATIASALGNNHIVASGECNEVYEDAYYTYAIYANGSALCVDRENYYSQVTGTYQFNEYDSISDYIYPITVDDTGATDIYVHNVNLSKSAADEYDLSYNANFTLINNSATECATFSNVISALTSAPVVSSGYCDEGTEMPEGPIYGLYVNNGALVARFLDTYSEAHDTTTVLAQAAYVSDRKYKVAEVGTSDTVNSIGGISGMITLGNGLSIQNKQLSATFDLSAYATKSWVYDNFEPRTCLIEGTKIKLYDGTEKNIEDIEPGDSLLTYDVDKHENIEGVAIGVFCTGQTDDYKAYIFEDGSYAEIYGTHSIWNTEVECPKKSEKWVLGEHGIVSTLDNPALISIEDIHHPLYKKHYVLITNNNLYYANNILMGHWSAAKYNLINSRMGGMNFPTELMEQYKTEAEWNEKRNQFPTSPEILKESSKVLSRLRTLTKRSNDLKTALTNSDYSVTKVSEEFFSKLKAMKLWTISGIKDVFDTIKEFDYTDRDTARKEIQSLEPQIAAVQAEYDAIRKESLKGMSRLRIFFRRSSRAGNSNITQIKEWANQIKK